MLLSNHLKARRLQRLQFRRPWSIQQNQERLKKRSRIRVSHLRLLDQFQIGRDEEILSNRAQAWESPEKESLAKTGESPPQASPGEAESSKEDKEQSSKPSQGEGESSSASQAPPAETSAAAASEDPKQASSEQKSSETNPLGELELRKIHRRRKPIQKPRQETEEEKAERERLEKIADDAAKQSAAELIAQEQKEKERLSDKEARSRQAAAAKGRQQSGHAIRKP